MAGTPVQAVEEGTAAGLLLANQLVVVAGRHPGDREIAAPAVAGAE